MNRTLVSALLASTVAFTGVSEAKGSFSSGGGGRSFSSPSATASRGSFSSSPSAPSYRPAATPSPSAAPASKPSPTYQSTPTQRTVTTTTTQTTRTIPSGGYSRSYYGSHYVYGGGYAFGPWGYGYGYNNGFMTGLILGDLLHPQGTVMYGGPGMYANNALLYPNGQVVNQQGYLVGTYINGVFTPVQGGGFVAQNVPQDNEVQQAQPQADHAVPVQIVQQPSGFWNSFWNVVGVSVAVIVIIVLLVALFG